MFSDRALLQLRSSVRGAVLTPDDPNYDTTRRVFNAMIDRRPALILQCAATEDVVAGIRFAREHGVPLSVRGGGHSVAGSAVCDGGVMLDFARMKGLHIDENRQIARAEPGLRLGEFDDGTARFGLATPLGIASDTGIAGLSLGGGLGWLNGKFGLSCDNVLAFDVVTADTQVLKANSAENADLYWALRGGSGNFGAVTAFEYQLHSVGPAILGGMIVFPRARAKEVLRTCLDLSEAAPDELSTIGALLTLPDGTQVVAVAICYCGHIADGTKAVQPLRALGAPLLDAIQPMPYTAQQRLLDDAFPPLGNYHYWKSSFARSMSDEGLERLIEIMATAPSPLTLAYFQQLHGAAARVEPNATAFVHRGYQYDFAFLTQWTDPAATNKNVQWSREAFAAMAPYLDVRVYVNNLGEEGSERVRAAYGANYDRLQEIKNKYDPSNLFRSTQNIAPEPVGSV
jgi:FAD/FMN-containing dehydrogenase